MTFSLHNSTPGADLEVRRGALQKGGTPRREATEEERQRFNERIPGEKEGEGEGFENTRAAVTRDTLSIILLS